MAIATYRTVQPSNWRAAAQRIGSAWAQGNGERLLFVRLDGDTLVVAVEGMSGGAHDAELTSRLRRAIPSGTPVVVNRVAGRREPVGHVAG